MFDFMLRGLLIFLCLLLFAIGCDSKKQPFSATDVYRIHQQIDSLPNDSIYPKLKRLETVLAKEILLPDSLRAENNYLLGSYYKRISELDSAAVYFHHATDFVNDSITREREGTYFEAAWNTYYSMGLSGDCFTISKKFKSLQDPKKDFRSLSWAYYWEQATYLLRKDYENALKANQERVRIAENNDSLSLVPALIQKADILYTYMGKKSQGKKILENLLIKEAKLTHNDKRQIYTNYGVFMYFEGNFHKAYRNYLKALESTKKGSWSEKINEIGNCYNNIAEVLIDLKEYDNARKFLDSTRQLGIENLSRSRQKSLLNYELRLAIESSKTTNTIKQINDEIYAHQDAIYTRQSQNELIELTKATNREKLLLVEKQATEIKNLKLQTRSIVLIVSIVLLTLIGLLFYGQRKLKFEKQSLQLQQRLFRSQMNPHFTYNTLYAIQNEIRKDAKNAENYLVKFSRLLRLILENSMTNYVLLEKEIEAIRKYLDLQLMHMPNKFSYAIEFENLEEDEFIFVPPMLLQPIIENSIEHGFSNIDYPGKLTIRLSAQDKFIACSIEDNGKGLIGSNQNGKQSASTQLIAEFLKKATKQSFTIINKNDHKDDKTGILVQFLIPYKLTEHD